MSAQRIGMIGLFAVLACAVTCPGMSATADPPSARTLIEQAIAAQGGMKALETIGATVATSKGTLNYLGEATFHGETFLQLPNQYRQVMKIDIEGNRVLSVDVLNGDHAWNRSSDRTSDYGGPELADMRVQRYVEYLSSLVPLVRDASYELTVEGQKNVDNASADVILVRKKDKPEVRLYFDAHSHLLVKIDHTRSDPISGKDAHYEDFQQDYRVVDLLAPDLKILAAAKIGSDAPALKAFLRKQALDPKEQKTVAAQIRALGDDKFAAREDAKNSLIKMGPRIIPLLEEATRSSDAEVSSRARECLQMVGKGPNPELLGAVVRVFAHENDPEALEVFLTYLPGAGDDAVAKEVRSALAMLAANDPKAKERLAAASKTGDQAVRKALSAVVNAKGADGAISFRVYPAGVKQAMKTRELRDGKLWAEWETTEIKFYHSLPGSLFGKP